MAELTQTVIDIVEDQNWDEDLKQDFYVEWMESEEPDEPFHSELHIKNFVNSYYSNLLKNRNRVEYRRSEILDEHRDDIIHGFGMDGDVSDPLEDLIALEALGERYQNLSPPRSGTECD
jgi:hypothetical protein